MAKYDKQIAEAKKIRAAWLKKDLEFRQQFVALKKNSINVDKGALKDIRAAVQKNAHADGDKAAQLNKALDAIVHRLNTWEQEGAKIAKEHRDWSYAEMRHPMEFLAKKLKLGKPGAPAYEAVDQALPNQVFADGKELAKTEAVWKDALFQIENQVTAARSLKRVIDEGLHKHSAYYQQLVEQTKHLVSDIAKEIGELRLSSIDSDLYKYQHGQLDDDSAARRAEAYEVRLKSVDVIRQAMDKNARRILKTVPKEVLASRTLERVRTEFDKQCAALGQRLDDAEQQIQKAIDTLS